MPSSGIAGTEAFTHLLSSYIEFHKNDRVLDIGCGVGRFGFLVREQTDFHEGRFKRSEWEINIIGVDIWKPYLQEVQKAIYTHIENLDALEYLDDFKRKGRCARLTILSHVLEHLPKERGRRVLARAFQVSKFVIVNMPIIKTPQEPVFGNESERHVSVWNLEELVRGAFRWKLNGDFPHPSGVFIYSKDSLASLKKAKKI